MTGETCKIAETNLEPRLEEPGLDPRLLKLLRVNPNPDLPLLLPRVLLLVLLDMPEAAEVDGRPPG
jgi:hypothetical protein